MSRILISAFGSGGDVFPMVPIAAQLRADGHEVMFAAPRSVGLYLRSVGERSVGLGDGSELSVRDDTKLYSNRFSGWDSWRRTVTEYVAPTLRDDVATVIRFARTWSPDVIVTSSFATAARVAAFVLDVAHVTCSIYPQHLDLVAPGRGRRFALDYLDVITSACEGRVPDDRQLALLAWGADPNAVLLHDPVLVGDDAGSTRPRPVGYPYWDRLPSDPAEVDRIHEWASARAGEVVVVTLGSFVGLADMPIWDDLASAIRTSRLSALVLNSGPKRSLEPLIETGSVLATGFVPLSLVADTGAAVVHHGGVGTTYGSLRAGLPSIVVPQAFDQTFVAACVSHAGVGVAAGDGSVAEALELVMGTDRFSRSAVEASKGLIDSEQAARSSAKHIERAIRGHDG